MKNRFRNSSKKKQRPFDPGYLQYTSIAYQLVAIILAGIVAGYLLDKWVATTFPVFKLICSFGAVIVALYFLFKRLMKKRE